jgi:hypothetical protein
MRRKLLAFAFMLACAVPLNAQQSIPKNLNNIRIIGLSLSPLRGHALIFWGQKISHMVIYGTTARLMDFFMENGDFNLPCRVGTQVTPAQLLDTLKAWGCVIADVNQTVINKEIVQVVLYDPDDYGHVFKSYETGENHGGVLKCRTDVAFKTCSDDKKACYEIKCDKYSVEICYNAKKL